jgi:hypothetical protein
MPGRKEDFHKELCEHKGHRVTVIWHCHSAIACSTGKLVEVGCDFVEVHGPVPTFAERLSSFKCHDLAGIELDIVIPLDHVCAVVEDVPECRKAGIPFCCGALDPPSAIPDPE